MKSSRKSPVISDGFAAASSYDWSKDAKATEDSFFGSFDTKPTKSKEPKVIINLKIKTLRHNFRSGVFRIPEILYFPF